MELPLFDRVRWRGRVFGKCGGVSYLCDTEHTGIGKENCQAEGKHCSKRRRGKICCDKCHVSSGVLLKYAVFDIRTGMVSILCKELAVPI